MDGEREREAKEAKGEENESARRLRAQEPLFLDLAHFSMPVDSYPNLPFRSFFHPPVFHLFYLPPIRLLSVSSGSSCASSTSDAFATFCYLRRQTASSTTYTLSRRNDDISTFSCSSAFQKTVRARDHPASAVWLPRTNAIEFTMQKKWFCATASSDTVACLLSL